MNCFWSKCSDKKRCEAHGSCVAISQAGGVTFPMASPNPKKPDPRRDNLETALSALRNHEGDSWITLREAEADAVVLRLTYLEMASSNPPLPRIQILERIASAAADYCKPQVSADEDARKLAQLETALEILQIYEGSGRESPTPHHVRYDTTGWCCSICGGWNDLPGLMCRWPHPLRQEKTPCDKEPQSCTDPDGCPTEMAVLKRFWREKNACIAPLPGPPDCAGPAG